MRKVAAIIVWLCFLGISAHAQIFGGGAATAPVLNLPVASPLAVYSVVKLSGWAGNCLQVQRASDSTTLNIGWVGNVCDKASADAFCLNTTCGVSRMFDESGNGNDCIEATAANQMTFSNLNEWLGLRPVSTDGTNGSSFQTCQAALTANSNALTIYQVAAPRSAFGPASFWEFANSGFTTSYVQAYNNTSTFTAFYTGLGLVTGVNQRSQIGIISSSFSNTNGAIVRVNGVESTRANVATSNAIGGFQIGHNINGTSGQTDYFAIAIYSTAHTSVAQMQPTETALATSYRPQTAFKDRLVYGGSSLIISWYGTLNQQSPWQETFGRNPNWEVIVMAVGGQSLATEYANRANYTALYDSTKTRNVVVIDAPSNDIAAQTFTSSGDATQWATDFYGSTNSGRGVNTTLPFNTSLKGTGFATVIPTVIARTGWDTTSNWKETARLAYNAAVVAGASANGYTASDRAANAYFSSPAATINANCYYTDGTHLTNFCYGILGTIDKTAIGAP